ncbi:hypothetical protein J7W19_06500 [Streptomyces mobaraensis NBRC 13819 = DSM 40847]|uniref:Uncharacterized protein n=1 Tax=Streptomyces mobaraensis (strain ATCC 29032 / DSM 40847 / JCM 4168 / NBRC 13819 / NCIMB 11159 / IPCR 16-22) TaxID=1223523 RepID=M3AWQ8_STRM1|nr:hypothetical protein [Streptomyces mobaraensis]EME98027.1 hypothetical protein H340_23548 [Streptomyces mobaraensis NBRC 13819 = DSM 40847]QTT73121.1 hypothetical protein J7W19_06500 [Streptomyces mobaraensis NBRC 13819 = DSM 40847]
MFLVLDGSAPAAAVDLAGHSWHDIVAWILVGDAVAGSPTKVLRQRSEYSARWLTALRLRPLLLAS